MSNPVIATLAETVTRILSTHTGRQPSVTVSPTATVIEGTDSKAVKIQIVITLLPNGEL